jgi:VanZ family protein
VPNTKKSLFLAIAWTLLISLLSLLTIGKIGTSIPIAGKDKVVHFIFYFVFVMVWFYYQKSKSPTTKIGLQIVAIAVFYGILMEICQSVFTTKRIADVYDALANSAGAITAFLYLKKIKKQ